jgi:hypothetical protein
VTLTGSEEKQKQCRQAIEEHVSGCVLTKNCEEFPLHTWNQTTIDAFYQYCLERHVLPEVNLANEKLKLSGPKDMVMTTESEFYRTKGAKVEEAFIASSARVALWAFETNTGTYVKYSLKLNAHIEHAWGTGCTSVRIHTFFLSASLNLY